VCGLAAQSSRQRESRRCRRLPGPARSCSVRARVGGAAGKPLAAAGKSPASMLPPRARVPTPRARRRARVPTLWARLRARSRHRREGPGAELGLGRRAGTEVARAAAARTRCLPPRGRPDRRRACRSDRPSRPYEGVLPRPRPSSEHSTCASRGWQRSARGDNRREARLLRAALVAPERVVLPMIAATLAHMPERCEQVMAPGLRPGAAHPA